MATTLSVVTVKKQMVAVLRARPALNGIQVEYVWPGDTAESDVIWLGDVRGSTEYVVLNAGRKKREEDYTFNLTIESVRATDWASVAEEAVMALMGEVEDVIAEDPSIGLAATMPTLRLGIVEFVGPTARLFPDGGFVAQVRLSIHVQSRLS